VRRVLSAFGVLSAVPVLLAVPVLTRSTPAPRPVQPHVATVALTATPSVRGVLATAPARHTGRFGLVGATWRGAMPAGAAVQVRTHTDGRWSSWSALAMPDGGPDDGSTDARAAAARGLASTDPLWVGSADGVQARVVDAHTGAAAPAPTRLHLVLVDGGTSSADASPGAPQALGGAVAEAAQAQPTIYTRAQWGADESLRSRNSGCGTPSYGSTIKMGFIHHTDTANGYASSSVPSIIRSIYAYHVESNGWCDIGYNFLVDRFGRIWEGRYGGITKPVIGAHTGGFNTDTFGASMIGNYQSSAPSSATVAALEKLFAWKFGGYYVNPNGKASLIAGSFSGSRYAAGTKVSFNAVSGHRDADLTTCPGSAGYAALPTVRAGIVRSMGAGFVAPSITPSSVRMLSGQGFTLRSGVIASQSWKATVKSSAGAVVKTLAGNASTTAPIATVWNATGDNGLPLPPDTYTITVTGTNSAGAAAVPFTARVTVTPPVTVTGPTTVPFGTTGTLSGTAAPNAPVTVTLRPVQTTATALTQTVTASSTGTWQTTFAAVTDYTWSATSQGWSTTSHTTRVAPHVTLPDQSPGGHSLFTKAGGTITLSGTALPGTTVSIPGSTPVTVASDGTWTGIAVKPTTPQSIVVTDARGLTASAVSVYAVGTSTATAPTTGYSGRALTITGNAGNAPLYVQLFIRPAGAADFTYTRTVIPPTTGAYSIATTLPAVTSSTPFAWRIVTTAGHVIFGSIDGSVSVLPTFAPTITGPASGYYTHVIPVSGKAVPGDVVTLWTRPSTSSTWVKTATATATSAGTWSSSYQIWRDTAWRVTSASGTSSTGTTVVRPTLHVPATAPRGSLVIGYGYSLPGQKVDVYGRTLGTTTWRYFGTVTSASTGRWTGQWHIWAPLSIQVRSHGQVSSIYTTNLT
jgi:hypothetical protein